MSTDTKNPAEEKQEKIVKQQSNTLKSVMEDTAKMKAEGISLGRLSRIMMSVDTNSPEARLNEKSIEDNNGGRIELVDDPKDIKK